MQGLLFLDTTTVQSPFLNPDPMKRPHGLHPGRKWCSAQLFTRDLLMLLQIEFLAELVQCQNSVTREWSLLSTAGSSGVLSSLTRSKTPPGLFANPSVEERGTH